MRVPRAVFDAILEHGCREYPNEACGLLFAPEDGEITRAVALTNALDRLHAEEPETYPRTARTGYVMDASEQFHAVHDAQDRGEVLRGIYHSHADVGAYFSDEDKAQATPFGEPAFPDAVYLVADIQSGRAEGMRAFVWDPDSRDFVEARIEVVETEPTGLV